MSIFTRDPKKPSFKVVAPQGSWNANFSIALYYALKIAPMIVAALSIYLGYRLFILGVSGQASLSVDTKTIKGQLLNAAPGLFFAVGGIVLAIVVVWRGVDVEIDEGNRHGVSVKRKR